ncbi:Ger(x)C family spore germination protein [Virgibacillus sp. Bac332]|uniref:Ger(x)C family spore germination protein n=1 Tax=Virgibacillus sp. Bac332 TaxID=2419842 RepID=UPI000EF5082F|nr:Ger(x)C family spore germination protein [Virgibacillus sp. Bac332]
MRQMVMIHLFFILIVIVGCSDVKEIQNKNYATAIGIDYKDDKYITYVQMVSLSGLSNAEGATNTPPDVFVSQSSAKTFNDALFKLYNTAQEKIIWSHVTSILLGEAAIKHGIRSIFDGMTRYNEFRLTPWVFGTKADIKDILSTQGFFNQGTLQTILHNPDDIIEQNSLFQPLKLHEFVREIYEPAFTSYIPSLAINHTQWKKNNKDDAKLMYDGTFFMKNNTFKGFFELQELKGLRWITPDTDRTAVLVSNQDNDDELLVVIEKIKVNIKNIMKKSKPRFNVHIEAEGYVTNQNKSSAIITDKVIKATKEVIKNQITDLYELGKEEGTDFFRLEHILYRDQHKYWKNLVNKDSFFTEDGILDEIQVDLVLRHAGAGKNN